MIECGDARMVLVLAPFYSDNRRRTSEWRAVKATNGYQRVTVMAVMQRMIMNARELMDSIWIPSVQDDVVLCQRK